MRRLCKIRKQILSNIQRLEEIRQGVECAYTYKEMAEYLRSLAKYCDDQYNRNQKAYKQKWKVNKQ